MKSCGFRVQKFAELIGGLMKDVDTLLRKSLADVRDRQGLGDLRIQPRYDGEVCRRLP